MSIVVWSGGPFSENLCFDIISKITMFIFQEQVPKIDSFANVPIRKEHGDTYKYIYICIYLVRNKTAGQFYVVLLDFGPGK